MVDVYFIVINPTKLSLSKAVNLTLSFQQNTTSPGGEKRKDKTNLSETF